MSDYVGFRYYQIERILRNSDVNSIEFNYALNALRNIYDNRDKRVIELEKIVSKRTGNYRRSEVTVMRNRLRAAKTEKTKLKYIEMLRTVRGSEQKYAAKILNELGNINAGESKSTITKWKNALLNAVKQNTKDKYIKLLNDVQGENKPLAERSLEEYNTLEKTRQKLIADLKLLEEEQDIENFNKGGEYIVSKHEIHDDEVEDIRKERSSIFKAGEYNMVYISKYEINLLGYRFSEMFENDIGRGAKEINTRGFKFPLNLLQRINLEYFKERPDVNTEIEYLDEIKRVVEEGDGNYTYETINQAVNYSSGVVDKCLNKNVTDFFVGNFMRQLPGNSYMEKLRTYRDWTPNERRRFIFRFFYGDAVYDEDRMNEYILYRDLIERNEIPKVPMDVLNGELSNNIKRMDLKLMRVTGALLAERPYYGIGSKYEGNKTIYVDLAKALSRMANNTRTDENKNKIQNKFSILTHDNDVLKAGINLFSFASLEEWKSIDTEGVETRVVDKIKKIIKLLKSNKPLYLATTILKYQYAEEFDGENAYAYIVKVNDAETERLNPGIMNPEGNRRLMMEDNTKVPGTNETYTRRYVPVDEKTGKALRVFGDNIYQINPPDEITEENKYWPDNSNSSNLCIITSVIYSPKCYEKIESLGMDITKIIYGCVRIMNVYCNGELLQCKFQNIDRILPYIRDKLFPGETLYIEVTSGLNNSGKNVTYRNRIIKKVDSTIKDLTATEFKNTGETVDIIIHKYKGHVFCVASRNHLKHILKELARGEKRVAKQEKILNTERILAYHEMYGKNKYMLKEIMKYCSIPEYKIVNFYKNLEQAEEEIKQINRKIEAGSNERYLEELKQRKKELENKIIPALTVENHLYMYDLETVKDVESSSLIYLLVVINMNNCERHIAHAPKDANTSDPDYYRKVVRVLVFEMMEWICYNASGKHLTTIERSNQEYLCNEVAEYNIKIYAHNGGNFDHIIIMKTIMDFNSNSIVNISNISDIHAGGRYKSIRFRYEKDLYGSISKKDAEELFDDLEYVDEKIPGLPGINKNEFVVRKLRTKDITPRKMAENVLLTEKLYVRNTGRAIITIGENKLRNNNLGIKSKDCYKEKPVKQVFNVELLDSLVLTNSSIGMMAKSLNLDTRIFKKGEFPHRTMSWLMSQGKLNQVTTVASVYMLGLPSEYYEEYQRLYEALGKTEYDEIDIMKEAVDYCIQDVIIGAMGVQTMSKRMHSINGVSEVIGIPEYLESKGGVLAYTKNGILKTIKNDYLNSITLSSAVKKIIKPILLEARISLNGVWSEYCNVSTGGLVYNDKVRYQPVPIEILNHKYVKITDPNILKYVKSIGYNENKEFATYKTLEEKEINFVINMYEKHGLVAIDANGLYPSSGFKLCNEYLGFPVGKPKDLLDEKDFREKLKQNKRCIIQVRVKFTEKGLKIYNEIKATIEEGNKELEQYYKTEYATKEESEEAYKSAFNKINRKYPLHQLIIKTKEGNRPCRPSDVETTELDGIDINNDIYSMTDIMFLSYERHDTGGLYELEYIDGIYWDESSVKLGQLYWKLMETRNYYRKDLKDEGMGDTTKLVMNTTYGVLLESMHPTSISYVDSRDKRTFEDKIKSRKLTHTEIIEPHNAELVETGIQIKNKNKSGNYTRYEKYEHKKLESYEGMQHWGSFILDMSKYIMFEYIGKMHRKEGKLPKVIYMDTDSITGSYSDVMLLKQEYPELFGDNLGQSKLDFNGKALRTNDNRIIREPIIKSTGAVSVGHVFLGKKMYSHLYLIQECVKDENGKPTGEWYWNLTQSTTCKGHSIKHLTFEDFVHAADARNAIIQNRGAIGATFLKPSRGKFDEGIKVKDADDAEGCINLERRLSNVHYRAVKNIKQTVKGKEMPAEKRKYLTDRTITKRI